MDKLVIIGAGEFQLPLIKKAKEMGYETHVFAWAEGAVGKDFADYFYPISITEKEIILEQCKQINPQGIVSIGSDLAVLTVNYVARSLHLPTNPEISDVICTNKYEMRKAFLANGIDVPKFLETKGHVEKEQLSSFTFPLIVKPTDRAGSRGITKIETYEALDKAIQIATAYAFEKKAIIEEFIEGPEYSCECISYQGEHTFLAFTQKYTSGAPHFIETGHVEPSNIPMDKITAYQKEIFKALDALHIQNGASHCEFKIDHQGAIKIIEIGSRMGGDCIGSDLVYLSTGYDFVEMVIEVACGKKPTLKKKKEDEYAGIKFIFDHDDIDTLRKLQRKHPETLQYVSEITEVGNHDVVDSSTRFGFYIFTTKDKAFVDEILG